MQISQMTEDVYSALHDLWDRNADRLPDAMRDPDVLDYWLFQDSGATRFHAVGGASAAAVIVFGEVEEGLSATVLLLSPDEVEEGELLREMRAVMDQWDLKRLTAQVPGPVKDVQATLKEIGFRREGHLRRATYWNGRLCGIDIYGMYKDVPRRRRVRAARPAVDSEPPASAQTQYPPVGEPQSSPETQLARGA